jgi:polysaccharide export outer membrane protein
VVIEGKVKKTGVYPISGRTTLLQALALAEGLDPLANENAVKIFRQHTDGRKEVMVFNLEEIRAGRVEDPAVKGNDVVVVEEAAGRAAIKTITDTIRGIFSFGRF